MSRAPLVALVALALALLGQAPALALDSVNDAALGSDGAAYVARAGRCGALLASCPAAAAEHPMLVLDVLRGADQSQRLAVPETAGPEAEGLPAVVYEDSSEQTFLVWESKRHAAQSRVNLAWLDAAGEWSEVAEISGDIAPLKSTPEVLVSRDRFELLAADGTTVEHYRTVVHITWRESGGGLDEIYYTPVVLLDGAYIGENLVYNLSSFDPAGALVTAGDPVADRLYSPTLVTGRNEKSVLIGFLNPASQRFVVFELAVLPGELSQIARQLYAEMFAAADLYTPATLTQFAERIGMHVVEVGARLHPGIVSYLAKETKEYILAHGDTTDLTQLAQRIGMHVVEIGSRDLVRPAPPKVNRVLTQQPLYGPNHHMRLRLVGDLPAPRTGTNGLRVFLSEDGRRALISWRQGATMAYRESTADGGWSATSRLVLGTGLSAERALTILRQRVREQ